MAGIVNTAKTGVLFIALVGLFAVIGFVVSGLFGLDPYSAILLSIVLAGVLNIGSLYFGDKAILKAYGAKKISESDNRRLHRIVSRVATQAGQPMPEVYVFDSKTPNAFATGRSPEHGKMAFSSAILDLLNDDELEGVAAHEMAHIDNRDVLLMTVAASIAAAIGIAVRMAMWGSIFGGRDSREALPLIILVAVTAPIAAMIVQSAISRRREFTADARGAEISGKPRSLASALRKLERGNEREPMDGKNPAHASLFISNPFRGGLLSRLFSTHPPMDQRIDRLNEMAY